jgi:DNA-binding CsgD family transcriptional regulator
LSLYLSHQDICAIREFQETVLSPLGEVPQSTWCQDVLEAYCKVMHSPRAFLCLAFDEQCIFARHNVDQQFFDLIRDYKLAVQEGAIRFRAVEFDRLMQLCRAKGVEISTTRSFARELDVDWNQLPWYREVLEPYNFTDTHLMMLSVPGGEIVLHGDLRNDDVASLELAELLLPAVRSGAAMFARWGATTALLGSLMDELQHPVLVLDSQGRERLRSRALTNVLSAVQDGDVILRAMISAGNKILQLRKVNGKTASSLPLDVGERILRTPAATYGIAACAIPAMWTNAPGVLIYLRTGSPPLPDERSIAAATQLTAREAEVARCLAEGLSNRDIATRLGISRHTVRHHAERIFDKLDVHSRKALALKLFGLVPQMTRVMDR